MERTLAELPFLPSPESVIAKALEMAQLKPGEKLVDLGCGDGRVLVVAAKRYGAYAVGVELNSVLVRLAARECRFAGVWSSVDIVHGDLFGFDVSSFDVVYSFPSPSVVRRLAFKLRAECREGCRVVVHDHPLPLAEPVASATIPSGSVHIHTVYLYVAGVSWPALETGSSSSELPRSRLREN